ncbi:TPM domain-containing protein [Robertkochia marina]|uniref:TPM domain-containing protein n=1 Tax=Robertkochia marina TaxID=1227945 RepID=A0A4S3M1B8_9FLAO|nr:TPM domain-containing protein [Robertkochia marina]THD68773.1 TPM domain-containing protein [Robertkochia marina]TRZ43845.1 TPM domain-containing protein [Robertkochia marina]
MSEVEDFLSKEDEKVIVEAIRKAEKTTSGEIRVHLEPTTDEDPLKHAADVFHELGMDQTEARNGVLIYIAVEAHKFVIYGDKGIYEKVPHDFWDSTRDEMQLYFRNGHFREGIIAGVLHAGEQLQKYFPWDRNDANELSDEVSRG